MSPDFKIASSSKIEAQEQDIGAGVEIHENVTIKCNKLSVGNNVKIGVLEEGIFRLSGVWIECEEFSIGDDSIIKSSVSIRGGKISLGRKTGCEYGTRINVTESLKIGDRAILGENLVVNGRDIEIGHNFYNSGSHTMIGGGSCFEVHSKLRMGDFCCLGDRVIVNTARAVSIGNEVCIGDGSKLLTHGYYQSVLDGFPVSCGEIHIEDNCWLTNDVVVNPGITIGKGAVIAVGAVVSKNVKSGSLMAGIPARVIGKNMFPRELAPQKLNDFLIHILDIFADILEYSYEISRQKGDTSFQIFLSGNIGIHYSYAHTSRSIKAIENGDEVRSILLAFEFEEICLPESMTLIDLTQKVVKGKADALSEKLLNQLRRNGIRFKYEAFDGHYLHWDELSAVQ